MNSAIVGKSNDAPAPAIEALRKELVGLFGRALPSAGALEIRPGLWLHCRAKTTERLHGFYEPALCVVAQGSKELILGSRRFRYDPAHYMINTVDLPLIGQVVEASEDKPCLILRMILDPAIVTSVIVESGIAAEPWTGATRAIDVSPLDVGLLDATVRLVRMAVGGRDYDFLGPLVQREIIYRLCTGAQGHRMRTLASIGGPSHRIVEAVERLRRDFTESIRVEDIANDLGMSASSFHAHFKAVTTMSPLQFQKQLRMQEARRLMISEDLGAAEAGSRVGYDDPGYFNRDFKKHFGDPPKRHIERLLAERQRFL